MKYLQSAVITVFTFHAHRLLKTSTRDIWFLIQNKDIMPQLWYHHKIYILFIDNNNKQKYKASHQRFFIGREK